MCVKCDKVLTDSSNGPSMVKCHLITKHTDHAKRPVECFQRKLHKIREFQKRKISLCSKQQQALCASYHIDFRIAKCNKTHIAEDLILPAAVEIAIDKLKNIPLSNYTIQRRIQEMSDDIQQQTDQ